MKPRGPFGVLGLRAANLARACQRMGLANTVGYVVKTKMLPRVYRLRPPREGYRTGFLRTRQLQHPVQFRYGSSDSKVFSQLFVTSEEYSPLRGASDVRLIVDCGANVGYSSAYLLSIFPEAHVIAVEPDARNCALLRENLQPYGDRVTVLESAVWSHDVGLKICPGQQGEWTTTVRECAPGEAADVEALGLESILERAKADRIDVLKVDIEGAERVVFTTHTERWLPRVRHFAIELHGAECRRIFQRALSRWPFDFIDSGEITIARQSAGGSARSPATASATPAH